MSTLRLLSVEIRFEQDVVLVRQRARELSAAFGFDRQAQTSIATALSEVARNAFQYAGGGRVDFAVSTEKAANGRRPYQTFLATVKDHGPGIAQLETILAGQYHSPSGLGIGLMGTRRLMDRVDIESSPSGTTITLAKILPPQAAPRTPLEIQTIVDELVKRPPASPVEEVQVQNQELLRALEETRERQDEVGRVNAELAETNSGVLALYDELETLHRISTMLAAKLELKPLIQTIVEVTTALTGAGLGAFFFHDAETGNWSIFATSGSTLDGAAHVQGAGPRDFLGRDLASVGLIHLRDLGSADEPLDQVPFAAALAPAFAIRSYLAVPVIDGADVVLGALVFASTQPDGFSERSERILSSVATQAVVGIEKARLFQSVTAASDAKDQFLAMLSHELRTPLNPVLAIISSLQGDPRLPPEIAEDLSVVWRNIRLEARLIDDLLDFNRLINGKVQIDRLPVDMHALIQSVIAICAQELEDRGQFLTTHYDAGSFVVNGDSPRLQQILWNVLKNANKFTPDRGHITIATSSADGRLRIVVTDTGRGFHPSAGDHIFRAFEQGSAKGSYHFGGLGLGLAIARMFVELHDGRITAVSEGEGRGASFAIELPLAPAAAPSLPVESSPEPKTKPVLGRILLVDDHVDTLRAMTRLLVRRGFDVTPAATGAEARKQLFDHTFDILVSDLGLPDCSGVDLLRDIRQTHSLPAIALSGYGMEGDRASTTAAGFQAHLTKPVDFPELVAVIERLLRGRSA